MRPDVRYATNGEVSLAWAEVGGGTVDMLFLLGGMSHIEHMLGRAGAVRCFDKISRFCRVILMDRRGVGLSDPLTAS